MPLPSEHENRWRMMFDSYCKKVIQRRVRNIKRQQSKRPDQEILTGDPESYINAADMINEPEVFEIAVGDVKGVVYQYEVYEALKSLKKKQLLVLLLSFWHGWTNKEIADHMSVTVRTIRNLRKSAFLVIQQHFEGRCARCPMDPSTIQQYRPP